MLGLTAEAAGVAAEVEGLTGFGPTALGLTADAVDVAAEVEVLTGFHPFGKAASWALMQSRYGPRLSAMASRLQIESSLLREAAERRFKSRPKLARSATS